MKCQILFSGKNKKNNIILSSAENAQRVVKVKPQWLKLPISRINFHGPKDVQAIEVHLYFNLLYCRPIIERSWTEETGCYEPVVLYLCSPGNRIEACQTVNLDEPSNRWG